MNNLVGNFTGMDGRLNRQAWWIGVVLLVVVAVVLNLVLGAIFGGGMPSLDQMMDPAVMAAFAQKQGWISLIIGLVTLFVGVGLWRGNPTARMIATIVFIANIVLEVLGMFNGESLWSALTGSILSIIGLILLYTGRAREYFGS